MLQKINYIVICVSLFTLIGAWIAVLAVDGFNIWDLGDRLIEQSNRNASLYVLMFDEGRPIEFAQWFCLASATITAAYISSLEYTRGNLNHHAFFLLFSVLFAVMLTEDAGNLRHRLREMYLSFEISPAISRFTTLGFFFVVALIPLVAVLRYGREVIQPKKVWIVFAAAAGLYAIAAMSSAMSELRQLEPFYYALGATINDLLFNGRVIYEGGYGHPPGYWITDFLVEETIELMGAITFVVFGYSYLGSIQRDDPQKVHQGKN